MGLQWVRMIENFNQENKRRKKYGTKTINPVHVSDFVEMKRKCRTKLVSQSCAIVHVDTEKQTDACNGHNQAFNPFVVSR